MVLPKVTRGQGVRPARPGSRALAAGPRALMATRVISAVVASGPMDSDVDEPNSTYAIRAGKAAHRPVTGGRPAIVG